MGVGSLTPAPRRAVFLDRDGVLNQAMVRDGKPYAPGSLDEVQILPGVREALDSLKRAGFLLLVVTNQPDVGRGAQSQTSVEAIHRKLQSELPLDDILVCYHTDADGCACRKPSPGLLEQAARTYQLQLSSCYMVGDRWRDIDAGHRAGCQTIFIDYSYREKSPEREPAVRVGSLREAAEWIMRGSR